MFSKKVTKIDEIFIVDLTVTTYCQIDGEDFVNFCGLLRKRELYKNSFRMGTFGIQCNELFNELRPRLVRYLGESEHRLSIFLTNQNTQLGNSAF